MLCFSGFELYPRWVPLEKASSKLEIRLEQDTTHLHMNVVRVFI